MKKIKSYTGIWNVEKVLYAINDFYSPVSRYLYPDNVVCYHGVCRHSLRGLTAVITDRGGVSEILRYSRCPHMVYEPKNL